MIAPPVPPTADLRERPHLPLHVAKLRDSKLAASASDAEFRAWMMLLCAAWHQLPAGSLPTDERELALLAGLGKDLAAWRELGPYKLHGWSECTDGRLYHQVLAADVLAALETANGVPDTVAPVPAKAPQSAIALTGDWPSVQALVDLWNEHRPPELPAVVKVTPARAKRARVVLDMHSDRGFWLHVISEVGQSDFLSGRQMTRDHPNWSASFDWLLGTNKHRIENAVRVAEGNFRNKAAARGQGMAGLEDWYRRRRQT